MALVMSVVDGIELVLLAAVAEFVDAEAYCVCCSEVKAPEPVVCR